MAIMMGDSMTNGAVAGSVLFVGTGPVLAQNNSNFFWNNSTQGLGIGTTSPGNGLTVQKSVASGPVRIDCINTNTASGANAQMNVRVAGASAGDAVTLYEVNGIMSWIVGLDNSESDKFKIASNVGGNVNTRLAVMTDGKVGVNVNDPTAQLHLAAGTASLAAIKLTSGTLLTAPEDGAIEWDGSKLYITSGPNRRQLAYNEVANVVDFGAVGDGTTDDSAAFQAAVDSLVNTGGVVWVPPNRAYVVGNVNIASKYPVWIVSRMGGHNFGSNTFADKATIKPLTGTGTTHVFKWARHALITTPGFGAGGGIEGVAIAEVATGGSGTRVTAISTGAIWVDDAAEFTVRDCELMHLRGTAIKVEESTFCKLITSRVVGCGETIVGTPTVVRPPIDIGGAATQAFVWTERCFIENNYATHILVQTGGHALTHQNAYHEDAGEEKNSFIDSTPAAVLDGCAFNQTAANQVTLAGNGSRVTNCTFAALSGTEFYHLKMSGEESRVFDTHFGGAGQTGDAVILAGNFSQAGNLYFSGGGSLLVSGQSCTLTNIQMRSSSSNATHQIRLTGWYNTLVGAHVRGGTGTAGGIYAGGVFDQVIGCRVSHLPNTTGIEAGAGTSLVAGNYSHENGTGTDYILHSSTRQYQNIDRNGNQFGDVSFTWDPGSLVDGAGETSTAVAVAAAALGDFVEVAAPDDLQGVTCTGYVSAAGTVKVRVQNETGATVDLASGTWKVRVRK